MFLEKSWIPTSTLYSHWEWTAHIGIVCGQSFLDKIGEPHRDVHGGSCFEIRHEGHRPDALLFGIGGVAATRRDFPWTRQVCSGDLKEIQDEWLHAYVTTPMITNLEKLSASKGELVDPTLHRQLIGCLMYLVNTRTDICFVVNTLSQFIVEPRQVH